MQQCRVDWVKLDPSFAHAPSLEQHRVEGLDDADQLRVSRGPSLAGSSLPFPLPTALLPGGVVQGPAGFTVPDESLWQDHPCEAEQGDDDWYPHRNVRTHARTGCCP